jgi:16S rRNA G1207 methylase RsmC
VSGHTSGGRAEQHYFSADPSAASAPVEVTARVWGQHLRLRTDTGVFARGRLDPGTAVLFRATEPPTAPGDYLDLGCGYGVIAAALARTLPAGRVWAVDVNNRALELTRHNTHPDAGAETPVPVEVCRPDQVPPDVRFTGIWSNPPIHIGKPALHELLRSWLGRLAPAGTATMVVGRNLGADSLQAWLSEQGWRCDRLASAKGFRVLRAQARVDS